MVERQSFLFSNALKKPTPTAREIVFLIQVKQKINEKQIMKDTYIWHFILFII